MLSSEASAGHCPSSAIAQYRNLIPSMRRVYASVDGLRHRCTPTERLTHEPRNSLDTALPVIVWLCIRATYLSRSYSWNFHCSGRAYLLQSVLWGLHSHHHSKEAQKQHTERMQMHAAFYSIIQCHSARCRGKLYQMKCETCLQANARVTAASEGMQR